MRYTVLAYALFILMFDFFYKGAYVHDIIYFVVQYVFAGSVALYFVFNGELSRMPYLIAAAFFFTLAIFELSMLRFSPDEYVEEITDPVPLLSCGITFIIITIVLIIIRKIIK